MPRNRKKEVGFYRENGVIILTVCSFRFVVFGYSSIVAKTI